MKINDFANTVPTYRPEAFLAGRLEDSGTLESVTGGLQQRFTVKAQGRFDGRDLSFVETWRFDEGQVDTLRWTITPLGDGKYRGAEDRLEGEAEGDQTGCAFHWRYSRNTPQKDGSTTRLNFNDWFFRTDEEVVVVKGRPGGWACRSGPPT